MSIKSNTAHPQGTQIENRKVERDLTHGRILLDDGEESVKKVDVFNEENEQLIKYAEKCWLDVSK
ncbi:hypothetical protein Droror1_Dr00018269 [Drosera rotundifolia]